MLRATAILLLCLALLSSCVFPGTATMLLRNRTGQTIDSVYFWETADGYDGIERLHDFAPNLPDGENQQFMLISPGDYTISVVFEGGGTQSKTEVFEEGHYVWVTFD